MTDREIQISDFVLFQIATDKWRPALVLRIFDGQGDGFPPLLNLNVSLDGLNDHVTLVGPKVHLIVWKSSTEHGHDVGQWLWRDEVD